MPSPEENLIPIIIGSILIIFGQILNFSVFLRLGRLGTFYGNKFGYHIPWCDKFPFTLFRHPQYVGTLVSIWGFFMMMRYPENDWIVLPLLQTAYYSAGAYLES